MMRITLCWVEDAHAGSVAGEPAFAVPGADAPPLRQRVLHYEGPPRFDALMTDRRLADIAARIAAGHWRAAIYGKPARPDTPVHDGDRIELLGPITADARARRHARVRAARAAASGGKWNRTTDGS